MTLSRKEARRAVYLELAPRERVATGLSLVNKLIVLSIFVATLLAVLETEDSLTDRFQRVFDIAERVLGVVFALEYIARLWVAPEAHPERSAFVARLRFVLSVASFLDLVAIAGSFIDPIATQVLMFRLVRLLRILRLARLGRLSTAFEHLAEAISSRRDELFVASAAGALVMLTSATCLYLAEGGIQPDKFGSIPRALWWSVATLTTIGYGDVCPVTPIGKVLASATAVTSIGLVAIPTGIIAAAFSDAMQRRRAESVES